MNRRGFLQGILAAGVAPYVVTSAGVLMPVKNLFALSGNVNFHVEYIMPLGETWISGNSLLTGDEELLAIKSVNYEIARGSTRNHGDIIHVFNLPEGSRIINSSSGIPGRFSQHENGLVTFLSDAEV